MNILVVEDDARVAELIKRGLEEQGYSVTLTYDGQTGKRLIQQQEFTLVILDIILPKINGLELCQHIRKIRPSLPIIILTALGTTDDKVEGFDAGADDYLVKPFDLRELYVRIRARLNRNSWDAQSLGFLLKYADLEVNVETKTVTRNGKSIQLTPKEYKLLEYMMRNAGRLLTRTEIAEKVWDTFFDTGTNFIDVYINYLRKKIDRDFDIKLIHTKTGMGFIFRDEPLL